MKQPENIKIRCLKGADEICEFIKEDPRCLSKLVKDEGLPAWKRGKTGPWRALDYFLMLWLLNQHAKWIGDTPQNILNDNSEDS